MQHDVLVIKSISFPGTVTSGGAAAVACLNVITRMKGRILIKTISPHTHTHTPSSLPLIQIMSWGLCSFSVVGLVVVVVFNMGLWGFIKKY